MPEGPEAHVIADGLKGLLLDKVVTKIEILDPKKAKGVSNAELPAKVIGVTAYGKRPIIHFSSFALVTFLSLTGCWSTKKKQNTSVILHYDEEKCLFFSSHGDTAFVEYTTDLDKYFQKTGLDWLLEPPSVEEFITFTRKWKRQHDSISKYLLDPMSNSTVGNYLKSEVLFFSGVYPGKMLKSITDNELEKIHYYILHLSYESYIQGGYSMKNYFKVDGNKGSFQCTVYGKSTLESGEIVLKETFDDRRITYYVPELQT